MKFKFLFSLCLAGAASSMMAQGYKDGIEYYRADQLSNAKELLERNLNDPNTDKAVSYYFLGCISLQYNKTEEAKGYFDKGLEANPDYAYNYVGLGAIDLLNKNPKGAEKFFKEAESKSKKDARLHIAIARAYYNADAATYEKEITKRVEKARRTNDKDADIYMFEGDQFADQKDWGKAAGRYEMATSFQPEAVEGYVKGSKMLAQLNPDASIRMLENLLELNPNSALGQKELADRLYSTGNYKEAAKKYGEYIQNPNHFKQDEDRYSFLLFYGGDYKKGYEYATELLAKDPTHFTAQRYQFMNAAQLPEMKEQLLGMAEKLLAAHSEQNKFAAIDYTLIADEFKTAGRIDDAINVLSEAIKDMPDNASFNKQLAMVYIEANQISKAADAYAGYIEKTEEPSYSDYLQQATFSFYGAVENKKTDTAKSEAYFADAAKYAKLASEKNPAMHKSEKMYGDIAIQKADEKDAASAGVEHYIEAVKLLEALPNPSQFASDAKNMYNYLGNYYLDKKDTATAKTYFNKYLQYDPENQEYRKFVESLD